MTEGPHPRRSFRTAYGAGAGHALLMAGCFAFGGYLASRLLQVSDPEWIALWLIGAVVVHDLVLFPFYSSADRLVSRLARGEKPPPEVPWRNHLRVPGVLSGILLLISFPLVLRLSEKSYVAATGLNTSVYFARWLGITIFLFAVSASIYMVRLAAHRARRRATSNGAGTCEPSS